jgi:hypothetical protein
MLKIILGRKGASGKQRAEEEALEMASLALQRRVQALFQTTHQAA